MNLTAVDGVLTMQDDVKDYIDRGPDLAQMSFLDFFKTLTKANQQTKRLQAKVKNPTDEYLIWKAPATEINAKFSGVRATRRCLIL